MNSLLAPPRFQFADPSPVSGLRAVLGSHPHRVLFENDYMCQILARLEAGEEISLRSSPLLLLTLREGRALFQGAHCARTLPEGEQLRLERSEPWEILALTDAILLFFVCKPSLRAAGPRPAARIPARRPSLATI